MSVLQKSGEWYTTQAVVTTRRLWLLKCSSVRPIT